MNIYEQGRIIDIAAGLAHRELSWKEKIALLGSEFLEHAQINCPVEHIFRDGVYIRRMRIPQGTLFIGRPHKIGHRCQLDAGSLIQFTEHGRIERFPGDSVQSMPGYQVILYALTDVIGSTIHPDSGERDIGKLEDVIFESKQSFAEFGMAVRKALEAEAVKELAHYMQERIRYREMIEQYGIDEAALMPLIENEADQIPFPLGVEKVMVKESLIHGKGLLAIADIEPGEPIAPARINGKRTPAGRYTNHAFEPNAQMAHLINGDIDVVALARIAKGTEITVDYRHAVQVGAQS